MNDRERIYSLRKEINHHNHAYYVKDSPEISDFEFDALLNELINLENKFPQYFDVNSPTQRVGSSLVDGFETIDHNYPMLSLGNTYSEEDLFDFDTRTKKIISSDFDYVCELKYDGVSISLIYENGELVSAITRGDGKKGDNVISNVRTIKSIPLQLIGDYPSKFEIRGEIFIPIDEFNNLNIEREKQDLEPFSNPRNTASGSLKMLDSTDVAKRPLDCYLYHVLGENLPSKYHFENLQHAKNWGFKISSNTRICKNILDVIDFVKKWDSERNKLPFEIDGLVIKVNDLELHEKLGFTAKFPRWAISYKFKALQAKTKLKGITYQVGRTGAITPVADLEPVILAGTEVKRASLHNEDQINKLNIRLNDYVFVEKGGEIIPKIVSVDTESRDLFSIPLEFIKLCPSCNSVLKKIDSKHYCINHSFCSPQIKASFEHFISKKAMDIDGLGGEIIDMLIENKFLTNVSDLYTLYKYRQKLIGLTKYKETNDSSKKIKGMLFVKSSSLLFAKFPSVFTKQLSIYLTNISYNFFDLKIDNNLLEIDKERIHKISNVIDNNISWFEKFLFLNSKTPGYVSLHESIKMMSFNIKDDFVLKEKILLCNYIDELEKYKDLIFYENEFQSVKQFFIKTSERNKVVLQERKVNNLIKSIEISKNKNFENVLFGLGIKHVGETVSKKLCSYAKSIDNLINMSYEEIINISDIGPEIAMSLIDFFKNDDNLELIKTLKNYGLNLEYVEVENKSNLLSGSSFVITGVFSKFSRQELKNLIATNGGINISSISQKTSYVIAGDNMGPSKKEKALNLGIKIISEDDFIKLINQ